MVKVGLVGPGPLWESRYRPALERLGAKIGVCAVYDPVAARGEQIAGELKALPVQGMVALSELPSVHAILLIDPGWAGRHALDLLCGAGKPVYIAGTLGADREGLERLNRRAAADDLTLMPEFTLRHTPATARLHELMATRIGRPRKVTIDAVPPDPADPMAFVAGTGSEFLVGLFDWCRYVIRTVPLRVEARTASGNLDLGAEEAPSSTVRRVVIEFARSRAGGSSPEAEVVLHRRVDGPATSPSSSEPADPSVRCRIECEKGEATIRSASEIAWRNGTEEPVTEVLTSDRSAVEVMLDHFCRRVVGGLIPIADVGDVCRGVELARAAEESLRSGAAVTLPTA